MLAIRNLRLFKSGFSLVSAACGQHCAKHTLPDLPYDYNALEPVISAEIMHLHHQKHHATYVNNLNIAEEKLAEAQAKKPHEVEEDQDEWKKAVNQRVFFDYILNLKQFSPPNAGDITSIIALQPALRFNGGGHINHSIFWQNLSPNGGGEPDGDLMHLIKSDFGSFENFKTRMSNMAVTVQGSGWAWLGFNTITNNLQLSSSANQDPLQATTGIIPLFGIDVWEHAYYLQYKNARPDYVKALWNIVNWKDISERLVEAQRNAGV